MRKLIISLAAAIGLAMAGQASANCVGSHSFQTCRDAQSGNSYSIQRHGNQTIMQGRNPRTGSTWSQSSQRIGNTTYHRGRSSNGNTWSGTSQNIGNQTYHRGINSRGQPYSGFSSR